VGVVLSLLAEGRVPPVRRTLLGDAQARARRAGYAGRLGDVWDLDAARVPAGRLAELARASAHAPGSQPS
jgi:hypothetical protein